MCICVQNQTDIFVIYLSVTYFQFQLPLFVSFYSLADERQLK